MNTNDEILKLTNERDALRAELLARNAAGDVPLLKIVAESLRIDCENKSLRAALEEVCRCVGCKGTGNRLYLGWREPIVCLDCSGTGRDYHGSDAAKRLLEGGR